MSTAVTQQVVEGFLQDLAGHWMAVDVWLEDVATGRTEHGRAAAAARLRAVAAHAAAPHVVVSGDHATVEWHGVPRAVITLQVAEGEITGVRLYRPVTAVPGSQGREDPQVVDGDER